MAANARWAKDWTQPNDRTDREFVDSLKYYTTGADDGDMWLEAALARLDRANDAVSDAASLNAELMAMLSKVWRLAKDEFGEDSLRDWKLDDGEYDRIEEILNGGK